MSKPRTFKECERRNCYNCDVYIEGTKSSRFFASRFQKDDCYTRESFCRPNWDDPWWNES